MLAADEPAPVSVCNADGKSPFLLVADHAGKSAADWANAAVLACYRGEGENGIHLLGPLAKKVLRIAPPMCLTEGDVRFILDVLDTALAA